GETWSAVVTLKDLGVERDQTGPRIVLGDSDTSHIVWIDDDLSVIMRQRALSSADALQTERAAHSPGSFNGIYPIGHGVSFDRGGTTKIRFPSVIGNADVYSTEFDAAADPSSFNNRLINSATNWDPETCFAPDGSFLHIMAVSADDSDLYSADDADTDTWTVPASSFTGTINHVSCNIYDRSGTKLAHIIDDGGTVKYDEDALAGGTTKTVTASLAAAIQKQIEISASLNAGLQTEFTRTASLDAGVAALRTRTAQLEAVTQALRSAEANLDAAVRGAVLRTLGLDAGVQDGFTRTTSLDGALALLLTRQASLQAAVQKERTATASLEAVVQAAIARSLGLEAALQKELTRTASLGAALSQAQTATTSLDANVEKIRARVSWAKMEVPPSAGVTARTLT
ncbi:hypothetical protein LCGC14_2843260, partial [marine sediment metagenome]